MFDNDRLMNLLFCVFLILLVIGVYAPLINIIIEFWFD